MIKFGKYGRRQEKQSFNLYRKNLQESNHKRLHEIFQMTLMKKEMLFCVV